MKSWELKATTGPNTIKFQEREQLIPIDYQGSRDERKKERKYKGRAVLTYHREVNLLISGWTIFVIHPAPVHPHVGRLEGIDLQFRGFYARPHGRPFTEHVWIWPKLRLSYRFAASVQAVYRLAAPLVFVPKNHAHHLAPAHRIDVARYLSFETSHRRHIQHRYWKITPNVIRPTPFTKETIIWRLFGVIFRKLRIYPNGSFINNAFNDFQVTGTPSRWKLLQSLLQKTLIHVHSGISTTLFVWCFLILSFRVLSSRPRGGEEFVPFADVVFTRLYRGMI